MRFYNRALPGFWFDKRGTHDFAFNRSAPNINGHMLTVVDTRVAIDQRQRDTGFQRRRKCPRRGDSDLVVAVEHGEVWSQYTAARRAQAAQQPPRTRLFFGEQRVAAEERILLPA